MELLRGRQRWLSQGLQRKVRDGVKRKVDCQGFLGFLDGAFVCERLSPTVWLRIKLRLCGL